MRLDTEKQDSRRIRSTADWILFIDKNHTKVSGNVCKRKVDPSFSLCSEAAEAWLPLSLQ